MAETVLPDIAAGALVPDDLGERVVALRRRNEACQARQQALHQLLDGLHHAFRDTQARGADNALAVLRDELDELLTAARPVLDALAGIDDADAAIQADAAGPGGGDASAIRTFARRPSGGAPRRSAGVVAAFDHGDAKPQHPGRPAHQAPGVAAVGPD